MALFNDKNGLPWDIVIDVITIEDVRAETTVSIYELLDDPKMEGLQALLKNRPLFVNVVYVLVKEQCQAKGLSDREFARSQDGESLEAMAEAFYRAFVDFGAGKKKKALMLQMMAESQRLTDDLTTKGHDKAMKILRSKFGTLSELLESTPEDSDLGTSSPPQTVAHDSSGTASLP